MEKYNIDKLMEYWENVDKATETIKREYNNSNDFIVFCDNYDVIIKIASKQYTYITYYYDKTDYNSKMIYNCYDNYDNANNDTINKHLNLSAGNGYYYIGIKLYIKKLENVTIEV